MSKREKINRIIAILLDSGERYPDDIIDEVLEKLNQIKFDV